MRVFKDCYGFETKDLQLNDQKRPQHQLSSAIANFVYDYDGPFISNLLIVYYAGHATTREDSIMEVHG